MNPNKNVHVFNFTECGSPPSPGNGSVIHNSNVTNGIATYTCNDGFTLEGNMHRVCINGSGWNGTLPMCHPGEIKILISSCCC